MGSSTNVSKAQNKTNEGDRGGARPEGNEQATRSTGKNCSFGTKAGGETERGYSVGEGKQPAHGEASILNIKRK